MFASYIRPKDGINIDFGKTTLVSDVDNVASDQIQTNLWRIWITYNVC